MKNYEEVNVYERNVSERENATEEEEEKIRTVNANSHVKHRQNMTEEEKEKIRKVNAKSHEKRQRDATEEEKESIKMDKIKSQKRRRENATEEEKEMIQTFDRSRHHHEREENKNEVQNHDRIRQQRYRQNNKYIGLRCNINTFNGEAIKRFSLGEMEIECKYCSAKGFQSENKGTNKLPHFGILCCNKG